jgi:hypothetical protein
MIEQLTFSGDGNTCVLKTRDSRRPRTIDVSGYISVPTAIRTCTPGKESSSLFQGTEGIESLNDSTALSLPSYSSPFQHVPSGGVIRTGRQVLKSGDKTLETTISNWNGVATMSIENDESQATVILARLPNWPGSTEAKPSVILPSEPRESAKIVLDKGLQTWNKVEDLADQSSPAAFPLVIERDPSSFQQMEEISNVLATINFVATQEDSHQDKNDTTGSSLTGSRRQSLIRSLRRPHLPNRSREQGSKRPQKSPARPLQWQIRGGNVTDLMKMPRQRRRLGHRCLQLAAHISPVETKPCSRNKKQGLQRQLLL